MTDSHTTSTAGARLGLPGLPALMDNLAAGGIYLLLAETATTRFPLLASSLNQAQVAGVAGTVILPVNPELFVERMNGFGLFSTADLVASNKLKLFVTQDEFAKKLFRFGAQAFLDELDFFQVPAHSFLIFDQADDLFGLHDASIALEQVQALHNWARNSGVTLLAVITRLTEDRQAVINSLMDELAGVARLGANRGGLEVTFDYWQSRDGTVAGRSFALVPSERGLYEARASSAAATDVLVSESTLDEPPPGEAAFFYMDPDLGSLAQQVPGKWTYVDTLVSMMHATRNVRSATCILLFKRDTQLRQLAEAVHTLRQTLGRYARIVVQEKDASLRYQNEALLLKLGLNLAINRDVALSRIPLLLDSLKGQIYSRDVDINFEAALASVLPSNVHGYLVPQRFVRESRLILERAETLNIPSALVVGEPRRDVQIEDILANNTISRPGDFISATGEDCYMFLNACPQAAVLNAAQRVLGAPIDDLFANVRFLVTRDEIQLELSALQHVAERNTLPDYSDIASTVVSGPAPAPATPPASAPSSVAPPPAHSSTPAPTSARAAAPDSGLRLSPPAAAASPLRAPVTAMARTPQPEAPPAQPASGAGSAPADGDVFQYDGLDNVRVFGKAEVPRAARRASPGLNEQPA